jgi:exocyst complex component 7
MHKKQLMALLMVPQTSDSQDATITKLESAYSDLESLLQSSKQMEQNIETMETRFDLLHGSITTASRRVHPLQSLSMSRKALDTRINRAISPALALLDTFKLAESLQNNLLNLSSKLSTEKTHQKRLQKLLDYMDCVDQLNEAINSISEVVEPVIMRLQEVVEFISRTKAADQYRTQRLREALITLKALYETEVDEMRFEGLLDQALLHMQDEFEVLLLKLKHRKLGDMSHMQNDGDDDYKVSFELGSELEIEVLRRISNTLAANDCLDICIDIYVKVTFLRLFIYNHVDYVICFLLK